MPPGLSSLRRLAIAPLLLLLGGSLAHALHEESPPAIRLTSATPHQHPVGRSWGNWFAFVSSEDLANWGALRAPGPQVFVFNLGFYDCAMGTTKVCGEPGAPIDCQQTPCPPAGTPYIRQITNTTTGAPANPSVSTAMFRRPAEDVWVAFDALGSFICLPTDTACLSRPASSRRQIFMINVLTNELRQITFSGQGDSVRPTLNRAGGMVAFESTAPLDGFPNPAGVSNVFVCRINVTGNPAQPATECRQISVGPPPAYVVPRGPSTSPVLNENGTAVAFESTADILGSGANTGIRQIYYATFNKREFFRKEADANLHRVTNGNGPSQRPFLSIKLRPNALPGEDNRRKVIVFESTATNLPGSLGLPGSQIYEVQVAGLPDDDGPPETTVSHVTTSNLFGNCFWPQLNNGGNRYVFTCDGDPLQNGTVGMKAFAMSTANRTLYQLTGSGNVQGAIANSLGQWFATFATTSDLTGAGVCDYQLYIIDFTSGKWQAATGIGQLPPDVAPQNPNSRIGLRNFAIVPDGSPAGTSETVVTSLDGSAVSPVQRTRRPIEQGNIGLNIGAPDLFRFETTITVDQNRVRLPPIPVPGFGAICLRATGRGEGAIDCDGGRSGINFTTTQDHHTDDSDASIVGFCAQGCRENEVCTTLTRASYSGPYESLCPICIFPQVPGAPPATQGTCSAGPFAGLACDNDLACRPGNLVCDDRDLVPMCKGPTTVATAGAFAAGDARITVPVEVRLSQSAGPDGEFCSDNNDDIYSPLPSLPFLLNLTTGTSTATVLDADPVPTPSGGPTLGQTITVTETGAPFDCGRLRAGDLAGARLVATLPILNLPNVPGKRDVIVSLRLIPDTSPVNSCAPFCLDSSTCDDGNACNGVETCVANRCAPGTPPCPDDADVCNGFPTCDPVTGTCGPGTPLDCDDGNPCTDDFCDANSGCLNIPNTASCDDGNLCTTGDACSAGTCVGTPVACPDDGQLCNGVAFCDPGTGLCDVQPTTCDDANPCTGPDTCDPAANGGAGACLNPPVADGTPCDDANACTGPDPGGTGDTCTGGVCGGPAVICEDGDVCNGIATCDPGSGCVPGTPLTCDDANACTADSCDPVLGCINDATPLDGAPCDDGNACTGPGGTDACTSGICTGALVVCDNGDLCDGEEVCLPASGCTAGTPLDCDDGNVCTTDTCVPATGCDNAPNTNPCDDGDVCTTGDVCAGGVCAGIPTVCDDGNACNGVETCDPVNPLVCLDAPDLDCDDGNVCTDDGCDPLAGCTNTPNTAGCDDGNACTTADTCADGECAGTPVVCNDGNVCNGVETCDPLTGCLAGTPPDCSDADECTVDTCDPVLGCQNTSEPIAYTLCRLDLLLNALLAAPADQLGGIRRKARYVRRASKAVEWIEQSLGAPPRQRARLRVKALKTLRRLRVSLQRGIDTGTVDPMLGDQLIGLAGRAISGIQRMGT